VLSFVASQLTLCLLLSRRLRPVGLVMALALLAGQPMAALAQSEHQVLLDAREALRKKDKAQLSAAALAARQHPLALWTEYWELSNRLGAAQVDEIEAFYARWPGTYVEDRLRNDWLLELGRRRDWANFSLDHPRFRMNDDREVTCYALLTQHLAGRDVREAARSAWLTQRDLDDGCNLLASTLFAAGQLSQNDAWLEARTSIENNRPRAARGGPDSSARRRAMRWPNWRRTRHVTWRARPLATMGPGRSWPRWPCCAWPETTLWPPPRS